MASNVVADDKFIMSNFFAVVKVIALYAKGNLMLNTEPSPTLLSTLMLPP